MLAQLADATSYAMRLYDYRSIGLLDDDATRDALTIPSTERGAEWDDDGLLAAVYGLQAAALLHPVLWQARLGHRPPQPHSPR